MVSVLFFWSKALADLEVLAQKKRTDTICLQVDLEVLARKKRTDTIFLVSPAQEKRTDTIFLLFSGLL